MNTVFIVTLTLVMKDLIKFNREHFRSESVTDKVVEEVEKVKKEWDETCKKTQKHINEIENYYKSGRQEEEKNSLQRLNGIAQDGLALLSSLIFNLDVLAPQLPSEREVESAREFLESWKMQFQTLRVNMRNANLQAKANMRKAAQEEDADPNLYNSCKKILEMDADFVDSDALGLTFVREVDQLGDMKVVELCPGGENLVVNSNNREKFVDLLIQNHFVTSISEQVSHFADDFSDTLYNSSQLQFFFQSLEPEDLDFMLCGDEEIISVEDWKNHTDYNGYEETNCQIYWFWEIVGRMSAEQRKVLLFFWTSVKYLPFEGFSGLDSRLNITKTFEPDHRLPTSRTCYYRLEFLAYSSMAVMQDRFRVITQEHIGCSFGNC